MLSTKEIGHRKNLPFSPQDDFYLYFIGLRSKDKIIYERFFRLHLSVIDSCTLLLKRLYWRALIYVWMLVSTEKGLKSH